MKSTASTFSESRLCSNRQSIDKELMLLTYWAVGFLLSGILLALVGMYNASIAPAIVGGCLIIASSINFGATIIALILHSKK